MWRKRVQLGLIHLAVAITLVPINSTLNRVMIKELALSATLVSALVSLPYLISPIQMAIGSYSDRHPIWGLRRTPYILIGLLLCVAGTALAPFAAFRLAEGGWVGVLVSVFAFGLWGMGYNLSAVSYLSLASEVDEAGRSRTIAVMFFLMIVGIIVTALAVGRVIDPYTREALYRAFWGVSGVALVLGLVGLVKLEPPATSGRDRQAAADRHSWAEMSQAVLANPQARLFFWYLLLLLASILGQDVLLEPYAGEAFTLTPAQTTRITSIWGVCVLLTLALANRMQVWTSKRAVVRMGNWGALFGFSFIALSGVLRSQSVFYGGVVVLGLGTGLATVSNLSLMLDMTTAQNVGLFVGAWGMANALSRLVGQVMSGAVRDIVAAITGDAIAAYVTVFAIEGLFLFAALVLLGRIDVSQFQTEASGPVSLVEGAALMHEAGGG